MYTDLPLPPNWETRFDTDTQRWFFVDHVNKKTSWDDPRIEYYSTRQRKASSSTERHTTESQSPALDTSYASLGSDYAKETPSSPQANERDAKEEEFMEYLVALRAAYPDYKDRQLAKLMEKWLGDSVNLRKFLATHLKRKVSNSSETTVKRISVNSSRKSGSLKRSDSPHSTGGYEDLGENKRPSTSPLVSSNVNAPSDVAGESPHMQTAAGESSSRSNRRDLEEPGASSASKPHAYGTESRTNVLSNNQEGSNSGQYEQTDIDCMFQQQLSDVSVDAMVLQSTPVLRCTPQGSNPKLRGLRLVPHGPDRELARGPNPTLYHGPDPGLLERPSPGAQLEFGLSKSVMCSNLI